MEKNIGDYMVENTLGEFLKGKKPSEVDSIKVLDLACGSGAFLLKAFDVLDNYYKENTDAAPLARKKRILANNLFGVDTDPNAVESAQANLRSKAGQPLPELQNNIKCGNSLIDDPAVAGGKAFKWNEQFAAVMKQGGFDVIIGSLPVRNSSLKENEKKLVSRAFATGQEDMHQLFFERATGLLKNGGLLGLAAQPGALPCYFTKK